MEIVRYLDRPQHDPGHPGVVDQILRSAGLGPLRPRIRCPRCGWRPRRDSRWVCTHRGCGFSWNTFETRGRCPRCTHQWAVTQCLACKEFSPHEAWYEAGGEEPGRG